MRVLSGSIRTSSVSRMRRTRSGANADERLGDPLARIAVAVIVNHAWRLVGHVDGRLLGTRRSTLVPGFGLGGAPILQAVGSGVHQARRLLLLVDAAGYLLRHPLAERAASL